MSPPLIELRGVSKSFGATRALADVSFDVRAGEVHVLAGENGAGKSTLIRVLSGVVTDFEGDLFLDGERIRFRDARDAARRGIATIHQELSLVGSMTVAENLALARSGSFLGWTRPADDLAAARDVLAGMDLDVDPSALVESLPLAAQQLLEIGRALARDARVLILDEPTSALSEPEAERLLTRVERLVQQGCGVIYISHRMEENDRIAHRITVLRDGRVVATRPAGEMPRDELVALMMGRSDDPPPNERDALRTAPPPSPRADPGHRIPNEHISISSENTAAAAPALEVRDLHLAAPGAAPLHGVSFTVGRGEIVGLAGLRGAGASEALAALFGAFGAAATGRVTLAGAPFSIEGPGRSIAQGLVHLANDRKRTVLYDLDVSENVTLSSLAKLAPRGLVSLDREARVTAEMTGRLSVTPKDPHALARALSGGNQQKVALLRCLAADPTALLLDEPTRGVDVGAKAEIHRALRAIAARGIGIALVASELPELLDLCDRIVVLARGRVTATLEKGELSRDRLRLALDAPAALPEEASPSRKASAGL
jgi:ribose transport system ATP-binding protein